MRCVSGGGHLARFSLAIVFVGMCVGERPVAAREPLRFNRDIRPILSNHCYQCHGPDNPARKGGLRLDRREAATAAAESGQIAIVPGQSQSSQLVKRIRSDDASSVMPPPEANKPLTARQKDLLQQWIEEGAEYEPHWSFVAPQRPKLLTVSRPQWLRNEIDAFVLARLESEGLQPSPVADLPTLIRRLSLDLTGLPPTLADVEAFVTEMGEATLADNSTSVATTVYSDATYRRWVNRYLDSPHYGERMAVDWLDAARYADSNGYQVDRDREMYAWRDWVINAFNTNLPFDRFTVEQIAGDLLPEATRAQRIATGFHRNHMLNEEGGIIPEEFLVEYCADRVETTASIWLGQTFNCTRCHDHKFDPFTQRDFYGLYAFFHNVTELGVGNYAAHTRRNAPPFLRLPAPEIEAQLVTLRAEQAETQPKLTALDAQLLADQPIWEEQLRLTIANQASNPAETPAPVPDEMTIAILNKAIVDRSDAEKKKLLEYRQTTNPERKALAERVAALAKQIDDTDLKIPTALIMEEMAQPRVTHILIRGVYDKKGEAVLADTPASLPAMSADLPRNRLGLARWLVDPANPLTARVTVNRLWQSLFGVGLVRTSEDFGTQGEPPSHPELLDWLADEFVHSGWDVKQMMRLLVSSATYRQSSRLTTDLRERDPANRLLARGPRFRLQSEFLRDQALAASGLLATKIGGPFVKPYHPPGLYELITATGSKGYVEGAGEDLHRRSMYTYWKRSLPNPAMLAFDAPFREVCTLRRTRTNTPLQALNLMNDPTYVEAARFLAGRMLTEAGVAIESQIAYGFRLVLARSPSPAELAVLTTAYDRVQNDYSTDAVATAGLLNVGARRSPENLDPVRLATMTVVASTILNFDEAVMKE